jgi:hypothetical protein
MVNETSISTHLSRNKVYVQTVEDDAEAFHMTLRQYSDLLKTTSPAAVEAHILAFKAKDKGRSPLPRIMRSPDILNLELRLFESAPFFHLSPQMSKSWIEKHLMGVSGGVSCIAYIRRHRDNISLIYLFSLSLRMRTIPSTAGGVFYPQPLSL